MAGGPLAQLIHGGLIAALGLTRMQAQLCAQVHPGGTGVQMAADQCLLQLGQGRQLLAQPAPLPAVGTSARRALGGIGRGFRAAGALIEAGRISQALQQAGARFHRPGIPASGGIEAAHVRDAMQAQGLLQFQH